MFYGAMGVIVGGRLGYVFFYNFDKFLDDPLWLFAVWTGGMSFHGGAIGVLVAFWLFARKTGKRYFRWRISWCPWCLSAGHRPLR